MWSIHFANETVEKEFLGLPSEMQARLFRIEELIGTHGVHNVGMPYLRHVQDEIWEIRLAGKDRIGRGLYVTLSGKRIIMLRFFVKKTQKTPRKEIKTAIERLRCLQDEAVKRSETKAPGRSRGKS